MSETAPVEPVEPVEAFARRARAWLADHLPPAPAEAPEWGDPDRRQHERALQRTLWDGGFAGICFPAEHGGLGLTPAHQQAFTRESLPYDMPYSLNVPNFGILGATLIEFGTEAQKARHLPAMLRGEELWVQFLSEPQSGSDLAGVRTSATRDGDVFILNGSKIWSSGAATSDYAMCLARTDWSAPKHRGLTMLIVAIHQPGVTIDVIKQVDGSDDFCQEFFDDVEVSVEAVVGEIDHGWTVASRLLLHERMAVGGGSPYVSGRAMGHHQGRPGADAARLARAVGRAEDQTVRRLVAEARVIELVRDQLVGRVSQGLRTGTMSPASGSLMKLAGATTGERRRDIDLQIAGTQAVVWPADAGGRREQDADPARGAGEYFLSRQALSLGGGSNEMQRNLIAERILGMPREHAADRDIPYRDVPSGGRR